MRKEISADVSPPPPSALPGEGRVQPLGGCWVPPRAAGAGLGARGTLVFVPELQTSQFLLGEFSCEVVQWRLRGFPERFILVVYCPLRLGSIPAFHLGLSGSSSQLFCQMEEPLVPLFPPRKVSRVTSWCLVNQEMMFFSSPAARDFSSALKLLFCSLSNFLTLFLTCGHQKGA